MDGDRGEDDEWWFGKDDFFEKDMGPIGWGWHIVSEEVDFRGDEMCSEKNDFWF